VICDGDVGLQPADAGEEVWMSPYHNQFVLGPRFDDGMQGWEEVRLWDKFVLSAHPSLSIHTAGNNAFAVCLIGYILDPERPDAGSDDILQSIVENAAHGRDVFDTIETFGGRWVLIVHDAGAIKLLHDAAGLRQVYYSIDTLQGAVWCASQPGHIARIQDLEMDPEAVQFIQYFKNREKEYWWPGQGSPYPSIHRLLPNHYLDLNNGEAVRFWPKKRREPCRIEKAIDIISKELTGMIQSAASRFDLAMGMSAGWDSRLMLAASRPVADRIRYYTINKTEFDKTHPDIDIPTKLLSRLRLSHDLIEPLEKASAEFSDLFTRHVPFAHEIRLARMYTNLNFYQRRKVGTTGNVSEVARCYYKRPDSSSEPVTAEFLMKATKAEHPFAKPQFAKWLETVDATFDYHVLDLFYWEQRIGSWFAHNCLEFDTAWSDVFIPFNSRRLLMDMLSVEERHRQGPSYTLYSRLIKKMWPDILCYPINPDTRPKSERVINYIKKIARPLKRFRA